MCDAMTTLQPLDGHASHVNLATQINDEAKKQACATTAESSSLVEAILFTKVSGLLSWVRNWIIKQKDSALLILTLTASEHLLQLHWNSRLTLLYSGHLESI